jgi:hypothetical protein
MPPNPHRNLDDTLPNFDVQPPGSPFTGNPATGEALFNTGSTEGGRSCSACHTLPFGAAGGKLGGVEPQEPTSTDAAGLFNGNADLSPHSDLKVPHTRNLYTKFGPRFGPAGGPFPDVKSGFGFIHDGAIPDLGTFLSSVVFTLTAQQVEDIATFMFLFPTGTKPAVGRQVTLPPGTPPTGTVAEEALLTTLQNLGNLADSGRHCELVAAALSGGRPRNWFLSGAGWTTDMEGEPQDTTLTLRSEAQGPVTFLCATPGSGVRLGADLDEDGHLNASDCAPADALAWALPGEVTGDLVGGGSPTHLSWDTQASPDAQPVTYEIAGGGLQALRGAGVGVAGCLAGGLVSPAYDDTRPDPPASDGYFYLLQARKACGAGGYGPGRGALDTLVCISP